MVAPAAAAPGGSASSLEAAVGAELDALKSRRLRIVVPVLMGVIMLFDSWDGIAIAFVLPGLLSEWKISPLLTGTLISAGYAGQFIGAMSLGMLAERFGRMPVFNLAVVWMCVLALGCAFASSLETLMVLRFLQGIAIGGALPVAVTYINELAPSSIRGRYFATFQFLAMAGYGVASVSSWWIVPNLGWRWMFGFGAVPLLLLPLVLLWLPESPRWLARRGLVDATNAALRKLGGAGSVATPASFEPAPPAARIPILTLFNAEFRHRSLVVMGLWFFISFTSFGLSTWVPSIYRSVYHFSVSDSLTYPAIGSLLFQFVTPTIGLFIDRIGRRPLAIVGSALSMVALFSLALFQPVTPIPLVPMVITSLLMISAANVIAWPYSAETYPTHIRAVALGTCGSVARAASTLSPIAIGAILNSGGSVALVFLMLGTSAGLALALWVFATRETKDVKLDAI